MYRVQYFKMENNFYYKRSSRKIADKNHTRSNRSRSSRLSKGQFWIDILPKYMSSLQKFRMLVMSLLK